MTVLYRLDATAAQVAQTFGARAGDDPWAGGYVVPGQFAPIITAGREFVAGARPQQDLPRRLVPRLWGVPPPASAGERGHSVVAVRNPDSPFWIGNLRNNEFRCLVPATAVMEWAGLDPVTGKRRQLWLTPTDQAVFAIAGVLKDSEIPSFAMLTTTPNAVWREAGRAAMPVILGPEPAAWQTWLCAEWQCAVQLLVPYPSSRFEPH